MDHMRNSPIAVIGLQCRFPGGSITSEKLWETLVSGRNTWSQVPADRFNEEAFFHPDPDDTNGTNNHRGGHFLNEDIRDFDHDFFNISAQEAAAMDPQQRVLLEVVYEALENAGQQHRIRGSATSVHVALFTRDYDRNLYKDTLSIPRYQVTGTGDAIASNRISYVFDCTGPSVTLDTGCSGGLVAVHQACNSLRLGESDMAIAAAANLIVGPDQQIGLSNLHMLSEEGRSYPFDSRGSGYGRGEGVAALILKPLHKAIADRDPIRGVILGSAVNQDGRTIEGITHPSTSAQIALQKRLYRQLNLDPASVSYVEAHGTGTAAGDKVELDALAEVFCTGKRTNTLHVGSIKSNIGHLECASGLAGLIKSLLILENRCIPPNADFKTAKEALRLDERRITVPSSPIPWPDLDIARVSVNSFGYGGTNAHVVVESAPQADSIERALSEEIPRLFVLTAKSEISLISTIRRYQSWTTAQGADLSLSALSYTLSTRRTHHPWRISCVAKGRQELVDQLAQSARTFVPTVSSDEVTLNFVFTGQGASWPTMGRELLVANPASVFAESMRRSTDVLLNLGAGWNLIDEILREADTSRLHVAELAQPATTAIQLALVDLLRSIGVLPDAVIGHSSGEIAAAYAAGYVSQATALRIAYCRGIATSKRSSKALRRGAMLAVGLGEDDVSVHIQSLTKGTVSVACANSPQNTTVSGDEEAIDELAAVLSALDVFNRKLRVDAAYHSHHMRDVVEDYKGLMGLLESEAPAHAPAFFSTVSLTEKDGGFDAGYWCDNLVSKVRFKEGIQKLCNRTSARHVFVEIGPHSALAGPTRQCIAGLSVPVKYDYTSPLQRGTDAVQSVLEVAGLLFERGSLSDFSLLSTLDPAQRHTNVVHNLPSYSWNHSKKHWHESRISREHRFRRHAYHDLVGLRSSEATTFEPRWRYMISLASLPWLADHVVDGLTVFPGSGYLCMAVEAISQLAQEHLPSGQRYQVVLRDIEFLKAIIVPESPQRTEAQLSFSPVASGTDKSKELAYHFRVAAYNQSYTWDEHCRGYVEVKAIEAEKGFTTLNNYSHDKTIVSERLYQQLSDNGNSYGPMFNGIEHMSLGDTHARATVAIPHVAEVMPANHMQPHIIHPTTLDIIMHTSLPLAMQKFGSGSIMPIHIDEIVLSTGIDNVPGSKISVHTKLASIEARTAEVGIEAVNDRDGISSLSFSGVKLRFLPASAPIKKAVKEARNTCWNVTWDVDENHLSADDFKPAALDDKTTPSLDEKVRAMNQATAGYVRACISAINCGRLQITDEHRLLFDWMQREYPSQGDFQSEVPCVTGSPPLFEEMKIVSRTGEKLTEIVSGTTDALQLVTEDGLLYGSYQDHSSVLCYDLLRQYVKNLTFKKSKPRILEIGGGTGGATLPFLETLKASGCLPATYDFTDVSANFFDRAAAKFKDYPINFRRLDIEQEPAKQGFDLQSYDVVLAFNCLHVTSSIRTTLRNARSLLRPDGRLVLIEIVNSQPYHHISYGTLPGYWKGSVDDRPNGPFMPIEQWRQAMRDTNLNMQLCVKDDEKAHISSLMVAQPHSELDISAQIPVRVIPVAGAPAAVTDLLQADLQIRGCYVSTGHFGEEIDDGASIKLVVDNGDSPLLAGLTPETLKTLQHMLSKQTKIMWVTVGMNAGNLADPRRNLITGLARSAQAENDSLQMVTVDVQRSPLNQSPELNQTLYDILQRTFFQPVERPEREYLIRDNAVLVPRLLPSDALNNWITRSSGTGEQPGNEIDGNATFIIAGGLGDLGQKFLAFLAERGAKHVVLLSRRPPKEAFEKRVFGSLEGCETYHIQCDIAQRADVEALAATIAARGLPTVRGIIQSAHTLQDRSIDSMTLEDFSIPLAPKLNGTLNLQKAFASPDLDFFIMLSSAANIVGTRGQANYNAGNAVQDALAQMQSLTTDKTHYLSFSPSMVEGTSAVRNIEIRKALQRSGLDAVKEVDIDAIFDYILSPTARKDRIAHITAGFDASSIAQATTANGTIRSPFFTHVQATERSSPAISTPSITSQQKKPSAFDIATASPEDALAYTTAAVSRKLSALAYVDAETMDLDKPISDFGLDSLIAIELRNWIKREFKASLQSLEILNEQGVKVLAKKILSRAGGTKVGGTATP
ncbi:ketoacyl-synt-domain-containing protein [Karstenula rhodostoma CBS 690.94]|uniref:Ketoacyl-synt-domain-containing protein n=1 Tax=Karstenula rhodostoma CBS 690.94 TaxID=1392251 RepID=A0A9P4PKJ1_9PLEO|nr:ketoacyl-synt-domain-containing protein [Karstenula rhodostoma CBS 690.94]